MLGLGEKFPIFYLAANVGAEEDTAFTFITDQDYAGDWKVYFFWPKDFCPLSLAEIVGFGALAPELMEVHTQVLGGSVESEYAHLAWRRQERALRDIAFPMLADVKRELCGELGILDETEGTAQRAAFIVDRHDIIRFVYVTDRSICPDPEEVFRVLTSLQGVRG